jgi:hypothetical protein
LIRMEKSLPRTCEVQVWSKSFRSFLTNQSKLPQKKPSKIYFGRLFFGSNYKRKEAKIPNSPSLKNRVSEKGIAKVVYHPRQI